MQQMYKAANNFSYVDSLGFFTTFKNVFLQCVSLLEIFRNASDHATKTLFQSTRF